MTASGSRIRRGLTAVAVALALALAVSTAGSAVAAEAGHQAVTCTPLAGPGGMFAELRVGGTVVARLRARAAGMEPEERCDLVRRRLVAILRRGGQVDPRPAVIEGHPVVTAGGTPLVTVLAETARFNGTRPALLAWYWANNLRAALNLPALSLSAAPYEGLPGVQPARASWYGWELAGRRTASGERFSPEAFTAAHRSLPFGTRVRVIAPWSGEQVIVRINDRGPWVHHRDIDLSLAAAAVLGLDRRGVAGVLIEVLDAPPPR
ncbi:MAG TPA: septal ring lytic transglycosylase RlpA family protein [Bacillota bacterium]